MFDPWVEKIPWKRAWQPTVVFLSGESHGQRSLAGYNPWGHKESAVTEQLRLAEYVVYGYTLLINPDFFLKRGKSSQNLILEDIKRRRQRLLPRASGSSLQPRSKCWVRQLQHEDPSFQKNRERASNPCRPLEKLQKKSSICRSQQKNNAARRNCSSSYKAHNLFAEIFEGRVYQTLSFTISHLNRSWCWLLCWRNHNFPNSRSTLQHKDFMPADESNSDHQQSHSRPYFKCKYPDSYKWALWPLFTCLPTLICTLCFFMHLRKTRTEKVIH